MIVVVTLLFQTTAIQPPPTPWENGETLEYTAKHAGIPFLKPGSAVLKVAGVDTVRGIPAWHFTFAFDVALAGLYENHSRFTSWTGIPVFQSLRFHRVVKEKDRTREDDYLIYPDSGFARNAKDSTTQTIAAFPIDDVAFFYFLRTTNLAIGKTYSYANYWRRALNPITVEVLGRRKAKLPDGSSVWCLILHPIVDVPKGMFSKRSEARLWLTDDTRRLPIRIESTYTFGRVIMSLTEIRGNPLPGAP